MREFELLFVIALVLYSFVIWFHVFKKRFYLWMVVLFGIGLAADASGTLFLCVASTDKWKFTSHTVSGLMSLVIMAFHFFWAVNAIKIGGRWENYFNRYSICAWFFWLFSFVSGIILI